MDFCETEDGTVCVAEPAAFYLTTIFYRLVHKEMLLHLLIVTLLGLQNLIEDNFLEYAVSQESLVRSGQFMY